MLVIVTGLLKYDKIDLNFLCMDKTNFDKTQMYEYGPPNSVYRVGYAAVGLFPTVVKQLIGWKQEEYSCYQ